MPKVPQGPVRQMALRIDSSYKDCNGLSTVVCSSLLYAWLEKSLPLVRTYGLEYVIHDTYTMWKLVVMPSFCPRGDCMFEAEL